MLDGKDGNDATGGSEAVSTPKVTSRHKNTQWKPNQSGNPAGRPKGSKNKLPEEKYQMQSMLKKLALEKVPGSNFTMVYAFLRKTMIDAIMGDRAPARLMARLFKEYKVLDTLPKAAFSPVLIVPSVSPEDWAKRVAENQAKYR